MPLFYRVYPDADGEPVSLRYPNDPNARGSLTLTSPRFRNDLLLFAQYLIGAASFLATNHLNRMRDILEAFRNDYLEDDLKLDKLALSIRAWLPFVSRAPFIFISDVDDINSWQIAVPQEQLPQPSPQVNEFLDEDLDPSIGEELPGEIEEARQRNAEEERNVAIREGIQSSGPFSQWQDPSNITLLRNDRREMARISLNQSSFSNLKEHLYTTDPVLVFLGTQTTPDRLVQILRQEPSARRRSLRSLITHITQPLVSSRNEYYEITRSIRYHYANRNWGEIPTDVPWGTLKPLWESATHISLEGYPENSPLWDKANEVVESITPLTLQEMIQYGAIAISLISSVIFPPNAIVGFGLLSLDLGASAFTIYLDQRENQTREQLNDFVSVDAALEIAPVGRNIRNDIMLLAASFLIPAGVIYSIRTTRRIIYRRITPQDNSAPQPVAVIRTANSIDNSLNGNGRRQNSPITETERLRTGRQTTQSLIPAQQPAVSNGNTVGQGLNTNRVTSDVVQANVNRGLPNQPVVPEFVPNPPGNNRPYIDAFQDISDPQHQIMSPQTANALSDFDRWIAGTGGIERITYGRTSDGRMIIRIEGKILPGRLPRHEAPNFNDRIRRILGNLRDMGLEGWERLHLWGPGFGDEASAGMMIGPSSVNQQLQNQGIETYIRDLARLVESEGGTLRLRATAEAWGQPTPRGYSSRFNEPMLKHVEYEFRIVSSNGSETVPFRVSIDVPDPASVLDGSADAVVEISR